MGAGNKLFIADNELGVAWNPFMLKNLGLAFYGTVTAVPGANQFTIASLAGQNAGMFNGAVNPYQAFVLRDAGGAGAAPQGEYQPVTAYVTATGTFTTLPYSVAVAVGDEILIVNPMISGVSGSSGLPLSEFYECWQNLVIDAAVWQVTDPATGTAWTPAVWPLIPAYIYNMTEPNANEVARLVTQQIWFIPTLAIPTQLVHKCLVVEFEAQFGALATIDNALSFFGLTPGQADNRGTNNIIGFGLNTDVLETVTDLAGVEETNTGFGEALNQINKFRMELSNTEVRFLLNEALLATHVASIPSVPSYLDFFIDTEAGGGSAFALQTIRMRYEDLSR